MAETDLIERLENAEVGNRDFDFEIAREVYGSMTNLPDSVRLPDGPSLPAFTTSVDSALSLVPDEIVEKAGEQVGHPSAHLIAVRDMRWKLRCIILMSKGVEKEEYQVSLFGGSKSAVGGHASLPIAICCAALKARQGKGTEG